MDRLVNALAHLNGRVSAITNLLCLMTARYHPDCASSLLETMQAMKQKSGDTLSAHDEGFLSLREPLEAALRLRAQHIP